MTVGHAEEARWMDLEVASVQPGLFSFGRLSISYEAIVRKFQLAYGVPPWLLPIPAENDGGVEVKQHLFKVATLVKQNKLNEALRLTDEKVSFPNSRVYALPAHVRSVIRIPAEHLQTDDVYQISLIMRQFQTSGLIYEMATEGLASWATILVQTPVGEISLVETPEDEFRAIKLNVILTAAEELGHAIQHMSGMPTRRHSLVSETMTGREGQRPWELYEVDVLYFLHEIFGDSLVPEWSLQYWSVREEVARKLYSPAIFRQLKKRRDCEHALTTLWSNQKLFGW